MPFGLTNAPAVFMDLMNQVCKPYLDKFFIVFIDDILIYSKFKEDYEVHLKLVLELLKKEKLFAKISKCEFWLQEVHFLGHVVNSNGIHVDSSKIETVKNWKAPKTPSEIRSSLEIAGKANVVADALSRKERVKPRRVRAMAMTIQFGVKDKIVVSQNEASNVENAPAELCGLDQQMEKKEDGGLYFMDRIWVPLIGCVRTLIMDESHAMRYPINPGANKKYHDLRDMYWWPGMKKYIATYVSKCLTCSKVRAEHQIPPGLLQHPKIPEWKWDRITMDFIMKLPRSSNVYDINWVIVDRLTKSAHFLAIREDYKMQKLARVYIDEVVAKHGVHVSIISDRDGRFTSRYSQTLQKAL
ncbi:putative reverse transcriptase domain-containing protein [Tanacetum coccineum]